MPTLRDFTPPSSPADQQCPLFSLAYAAANSAPAEQYDSAPSQGADDINDVNESIWAIAKNDKHFDPFQSDDGVDPRDTSVRRLNFGSEQRPTSTLRGDRNNEKVNCFYFCSP